MKSTIKTAAWICAILLVSVSCYDDGTDCFDTATRISLYPDVELFNADGTTASGNESFVSAVTVNVGPAVSDMAWEASVPASAAWATVRRTTVASIFEEAAGGARHDLSADGIELVLQPNTEYRRTVVVTIAAADGTTADYEFTQLGQKADAAVTSETAQLVFMAAGGSETVTYTSNMGDAYAYEVVYGEGSADWLTVGDGGGGTLTLTMDPEQITLISKDVGPGIPDLERAMTEGYSTANEEARSLGFGAGMGLPNMKKYTDSMKIDTEVGVGTTITMTVNL